MTHDRITQIRIKGMRAIEDVTLDLDGLTVLIGENGSGKSTILEALEILRKGASSEPFISGAEIAGHGPFEPLLRSGAKEIVFDVVIASSSEKLRYELVLRFDGSQIVIFSECAYRQAPNGLDWQHAFVRTPAQSAIHQSVAEGEDGDFLTSPELWSIHKKRDLLGLSLFDRSGLSVLQRIGRALRSIDVQVPFQHRAIWQDRQLNPAQGARKPSILQPTKQLNRYGENLPSAIVEIQNRGEKARLQLLDRVRLGLGQDLNLIRVLPTGSGNIEIGLGFESLGDQVVPASALSDGQLSFLAFVVLIELSADASVLCFDEPELHLHPSLVSRVILMLEDVAKTTPVIIATHSDRLLDSLADPAKSVVLCELNQHRAMTLARPNGERLHKWLQKFSGIGSIRAEGYEGHIFAPAVPTHVEASK